MSDSLPPVWSAEQHTIAKHRILQAYLAAWMPILSRQSVKVDAAQQAIKYIDGFAGPAIYEKGEKGSPILALEAALNHTHDFPVPVDLIFIEDSEDRFTILQQQLNRYATDVAASKNVRSVRALNGDCRVVMGKMLDNVDTRREKFGPAFVFLDQFGYSSVPMELVGRILSHGQCEVLTYLFWRDLDRFITDETKHAGITTAFGCDDWRGAIPLPAGERERIMRDTYTKSLKDHAKAKYVWPFAMFNENERLLYWLFFCTNSLRGLEEMKKAMCKVDQTGAFSFSDKAGLGQFVLLKAYGDEQLERDLEKGLAGRTLSVQDVKEWVLTETPAYLFKTVLARLEKRGIARVINPPPTRRPGTYPDDKPNMQITFELTMFGGW
jgi:three-Cys-motif partner protein